MSIRKEGETPLLRCERIEIRGCETKTKIESLLQEPRNNMIGWGVSEHVPGKLVVYQDQIEQIFVSGSFFIEKMAELACDVRIILIGSGEPPARIRKINMAKHGHVINIAVM
jgi:lysine/ornithine N-monooxygenase